MLAVFGWSNGAEPPRLLLLQRGVAGPLTPRNDGGSAVRLCEETVWVCRPREQRLGTGARCAIL